MDGKGGCCIARYAGTMYDKSKIDRIMLRYRPIAPKPATNSSGSGSSTAENSSTTQVRTGRGKRRYVRNGGKKVEGVSSGGVTKRCKYKNGGGRKKKSISPPTEENESNGRSKSTVSTGSISGGDHGGFAVTLPLLPETPERKEGSLPSSQEYPTARGTFSNGADKFEKVPLFLNFSGDGVFQQAGRRMAVQTWVRVESITETWGGGIVGGVDVYGGGLLLGSTDEEKLMNLERDTCPGFISDGVNRVIWVNKAYREKAVGQVEEAEEEEAVEVLAWLVMKDGLQLPPKNWPAFTCRVRVVTCGKGKSSSTLIPCDVWRLEGGQGFAWRLDTKAALSLGR